MLKKKNRNCYKIILMIEITIKRTEMFTWFCIPPNKRDVYIGQLQENMFKLQKRGGNKNFKKHCNWLKWPFISCFASCWAYMKVVKGYIFRKSDVLEC